LRKHARTTGFALFGKGLNALGKAFAECHPWHTSHGNQRHGKAELAECFLSGTQQSLCQVLIGLSAKKSNKNGQLTVTRLCRVRNGNALGRRSALGKVE